MARANIGLREFVFIGEVAKFLRLREYAGFRLQIARFLVAGEVVLYNASEHLGVLCNVGCFLVVLIGLFDAHILKVNFVLVGQLRGFLHRDSKWVVFNREQVL